MQSNIINVVEQRQPLRYSRPIRDGSYCMKKNDPRIWFSKCSSMRSEKTALSDVHLSTAKELTALSREDREKILEEVNGIPSAVKEDESLIERCLIELEIAIEQVHQIDRSAYDQAMAMRPQLLKDRRFRLMFLRADSYNVSNAAIRIVKFFQSKRTLFGDDKLVDRISPEDLSADDRLHSSAGGGLQILPCKDQAGRAVAFRYRKKTGFKTWMNQFRNDWYQIMEMLEKDESVQRKGLVFVGYYHGVNALDDNILDCFRNIHILNDALPVRFCALHFCYNSPQLRPLVLLVQSAIRRDHRLRFRSHFGSHVECQYHLMGFGIPQCILPIDSAGKYRTNFAKVPSISLQAKAPCQLRKATTIKTSSLKNVVPRTGPFEEEIILPESDIRSNDIILGKGSNQLHPANLKLSKLIQERRTAYLACSKLEKTRLSMSIVNIMKASKARFLKRRESNKDEWVEVSNLEARNAISHRLRNRVPLRWRSSK